MNADYPSTKSQPKLTAADYHGTSIQLIEKDGSRWLTARDLGLCLGYNEANARQGIINLYNRHVDEFTEKDSCEIKLISQGQERNTRIFSPSGCHLLSFFANTGRAKDFRAWAKEVLVQAATSAVPQTTPDRLEAHMAQLAQGMQMILSQNQLVHKYIALLEMNQKGKRRITREDEAVIRELRAEGMTQADIARLLRISPASVNLILNNRYPFGKAAADKIGIDEALAALVAREEAKVRTLLGLDAETTAPPPAMTPGSRLRFADDDMADDGEV